MSSSNEQPKPNTGTESKQPQRQGNQNDDPSKILGMTSSSNNNGTEQTTSQEPQQQGGKNDDPSKARAMVNSLAGTIVEAAGDLTNSASWQQSGKERHARGEAEYGAAQAQGFAKGTMDRLQGKIDTITGAITGNKDLQAQGNAKLDKGAAQQTVNKPIL